MSLAICSPSSYGANIVSSLFHTYWPFLPTRVLQGQVPGHNSSSAQCLTYTDPSPSSHCAPKVSMSVTKWFHLQKQKLMDLSEGRTGPCTLTQRIKEEYSFSNVLRGDLGVGKCNASSTCRFVAGLEPRAQHECQPNNNNNNPIFQASDMC